MVDKKIKISADTSSIKKSVLDLSKDASKSFQEIKKSILDLSKDISKSFQDIKKQMESTRKELAETLKAQSRLNKTVEDELKNRQKVLDVTKKQSKLQEKSSSTKSPQLTGVMRALGLSRFLGPGGFALGAITGGAGLAFSRTQQGYNTFQGGIQDRIGLRGRGVKDINLRSGLSQRAAEAGLNEQSVRRARLQAMDVFGAAGSTQEAVINRARFERGYGIEQGTLSNLGGQLRGQLGGKGADKAVMTIQAGLISSGIRDEIGPYLETAASMLTSLNESGLTFSDSSISLLTSAVKGGAISPERAGKMISGVDQAIRGSSGEANAFFQQVFGKAGIGGSTLGGTRAAIRSGGLFGANLKASYLSDVDRSALQQLGIGGSSSTMGKVARSTIGTLNKMFGSDAEIQEQLKSGDEGTRNQGASRRLQRLSFIRQTFGLQNEVQAGEVQRLLSEAANPKTNSERQAQIQKKIEKIQAGSTELGNLQEINKSTAGLVTILQNKTISVQDKLGEKTAPLFMTIGNTMNRLDMLLTAIIDRFGIKTPQQGVEEAIAGKSVLSQKDFDMTTGGNPELKKKFSAQMQSKYMENKSRLGTLDSNNPAHRAEIDRLKAEQTRIQDSFSGVSGLDFDKSGMKALSKDLQMRQKEEASNFMKQSPSEVFKNIFSDMKTAFVGNDKPATANPQSNQSDASKEMLTQLKNIAKTNRDTSLNTKNINALPANSGKTY